MTYSTNSVCIQVFMQCITLVIIHQYREQMIYILFIRQQVGHIHQRVPNTLIIQMGYLFTMCIIFNKVL